MKTITITISGKGLVWWNERILDIKRFSKDISFFDMEENQTLDRDSLYEFYYITDDLKIKIDDKLIIKKGKYIKTKNYFSKIFENPSVMIGGDDIYFEDTYNLELENDEIFDPMKLQLVKSDYEIDFIPFGIILEYILYNGKKIYCNGEYECNRDIVDWNRHIIDYPLPYVK